MSSTDHELREDALPVDRMQVSSSDGTCITFDVTGSGETALVFVHGWAGNRGHWDEQQQIFGADYRVVRIDLAGHGESGLGRQGWTVAAFAEDIAAVVGALDLPRVVLIGHSLGGSAIVAAAGLLGARVAGVIGIDTWFVLGEQYRNANVDSSILLPDMRTDFRTNSARFVELMCGPTSPPHLVERITDEVANMKPEIALGILGGASGDSYAETLEKGLRSLNVPLAAISSESFRPKDEAAFASFGIQNVVIRGTGHYLMLERPADFNAELAVALSRTKA